ncbi:MAG: AurF N-oxygenase family protein [Streptosporangiaceae bacterium]
MTTPVQTTKPPRCPGGDHTYALSDRERVAERLLTASERHSFDPRVDVRWDLPADPDLFYFPPTAVSLYETSLWDRMTHRERVELSRHESASVAYMGIWFEVILMQLLTRHIYDLDLTSRHVAYGLTEIGDECRHSTMFGRLIDTLDTPRYHPSPSVQRRGRLLKTVVGPGAAFGAVLIVEELLDAIQRVTFPDEDVQPFVRDVTRIHVIEEARHVKYAREELKRQVARCNAAQLEAIRWVLAETAYTVARNLVHLRCYAEAGLDPRTARRVASESPHRRATIAWAGRRMIRFFDSLGLVRGPSTTLWRSGGFLP